MRRGQKAPILLSAVVLAGCGGGPDKASPTPKKVTKKERAERKRDRDRIDRSSLPPDAKRELKEAQDLLDDIDE